tara:strand:- start:204 stop:767 length:564 start_codon:yes stop_codon:yes gene_type:complete
MAVVINGNGTVTGVSVGGLPDGIVDTDMLAANAVTAAKTNPGLGEVLQVVTDTRTSSLSLTSDDTYNTITGLSVDITPASTSSKILVLVALTMHTSTSMKLAYRLRRDSTALGESTVGGTSLKGISGSGHNGTRGVPINFHFLDSPSTTSSITYSVQEIHNTGTFVLNDAGSNYQGSSMITAIEVAS